MISENCYQSILALVYNSINASNFRCFLTAPLVVGVCSHGWSCYLSRCYYVSTDRDNHTTARVRCHSKNAELVSISDKDENNFVTSIWLVY